MSSSWRTGSRSLSQTCSQGDHRNAVGRKPLELLQCEIFNDLCIESQQPGAIRKVFGIGADLRVGMQQLHQLHFVDIPSPIAEDGPKRRCTAGVVCDLTASV